jgi:hypothetical protein
MNRLTPSSVDRVASSIKIASCSTVSELSKSPIFHRTATEVDFERQSYTIGARLATLLQGYAIRSCPDFPSVPADSEKAPRADLTRVPGVGGVTVGILSARQVSSTVALKEWLPDRKSERFDQNLTKQLVLFRYQRLNC